MQYDKRDEIRMSFLNNIPNIISASRSIAALVMLLFPVFSGPFWIFYCWCGFSDMIDGMLARKMNVTTELGSRIDSIADLVFVICSAMMILPSMNLPVCVWMWTAAIGLAKITGIAIGSCRQQKFTVPHSRSNKLTGILLFFLPVAIIRFNVLIPSAIVCISATESLFEDFRIIHIWKNGKV